MLGKKDMMVWSSPTRWRAHCQPSAVWSVIWDSIWRELLSEVPDNMENCHLNFVMTTVLRSNPQWALQLANKLFSFLIYWHYHPGILCANGLLRCKNGRSWMILQVETLDLMVTGQCSYMWSVVVRLFGCPAKFSETILGMAYGSEMDIQLMGDSSGGHSHSQRAKCAIPQSLRHRQHCVVCYKTAHFSVAFQCDGPTCAITMLFNQHLHQKHRPVGRFVLAKKKRSLMWILIQFYRKIVRNERWAHKKGLHLKSKTKKPLLHTFIRPSHS